MPRVRELKLVTTLWDPEKKRWARGEIRLKAEHPVAQTFLFYKDVTEVIVARKFPGEEREHFSCYRLPEPPPVAGKMARR